jgi:hypothetical protein
MTTNRFTSREQIIAKIDKFTNKAKGHRENQRQCYLAAANIRDTARRCEDSAMLSLSVRKDSLGDVWGKKAERLETKTLASLKRKLSEFDTQTIPGITDDKTVEGI